MCLIVTGSRPSGLLSWALPPSPLVNPPPPTETNWQWSFSQNYLFKCNFYLQLSFILAVCFMSSLLNESNCIICDYIRLNYTKIPGAMKIDDKWRENKTDKLEYLPENLELKWRGEFNMSGENQNGSVSRCQDQDLSWNWRFLDLFNALVKLKNIPLLCPFYDARTSLTS